MRCAKCNKKLGLIEYKCKCEKLFCISHLHAEEHNCNYDYKEEARLLLEKRVNPNLQNIKGSTALDLAITEGNLELVELLLEKGANLDLTNEKQGGYSPLMLAAEYGKKDIVKLLLEKGAKLDLEDSEGLSALQYAIRWKQQDIAELLLTKGAKIPSRVVGDPKLLALLLGIHPAIQHL